MKHSNRFTNIIIISLSVLIIIGVSLSAYMFYSISKRDGAIPLQLTEGKSERVLLDNLHALKMLPGEETEYKFWLESDIQDDYVLNIGFGSYSNDSVFEDVIFVTLKTDDSVLCEKVPLAEFFDGKKIESLRDPDDGKFLLTVELAVSEDISDEVKNSEAFFDIVLTALSKTN